jgi:DNA-repair protein complementing XP-A cells
MKMPLSNKGLECKRGARDLINTLPHTLIMSDSTRSPPTMPRTPPPRERDVASLQLTPEQIKQFEIHRLKAKALQREREEASSSSLALNGNNKRPLGVTSAANASPTGPAKKDGKLQRDSRLGTYFEYDLSKMVNSKGGFLVEDGKEVDEAFIRKEKQRELERTKQTTDEREHGVK